MLRHLNQRISVIRKSWQKLTSGSMHTWQQASWQSALLGLFLVSTSKHDFAPHLSLEWSPKNIYSRLPFYLDKNNFRNLSFPVNTVFFNSTPEFLRLTGFKTILPGKNDNLYFVFSFESHRFLLIIEWVTYRVTVFEMQIVAILRVSSQ